jgi:hypothetical protein
MSEYFSWESPGSRLVLSAVLQILAERGFEGLTAEELRVRAGAAGPAVGDALDMEA